MTFIIRYFYDKKCSVDGYLSADSKDEVESMLLRHFSCHRRKGDAVSFKVVGESMGDMDLYYKEDLCEAREKHSLGHQIRISKMRVKSDETIQ